MSGSLVTSSEYVLVKEICKIRGQVLGNGLRIHKDHIKLDGTRVLKTGVKLNIAILSKLGGGANCSSPGPFPSVQEPRDQTTDI